MPTPSLSSRRLWPFSADFPILAGMSPPVKCFRPALLLWGALFALPVAVSVAPSAAQEAAKSPPVWVEGKESLTLMQGDKLAFQYIFRSGRKPIIYPLLSPGGENLARDYPMKPAEEGGTSDHIHQRSMWFTHGEVNGVDFWAEQDGGGEIVHQGVESKGVDPSGLATFKATAKWKVPDGTEILAETKTIGVHSTDAGRMIDYTIELQALIDEVHFGDTKEGSFGIRVPDSMMVDRKLGGKIINDQGKTDKDAWGLRSKWVDYSGPVKDKTYGITVLEHPLSFGAPCRWHVRTYGLFAANPFGEFHFIGGDKTDGFRLKKGDSIKLRYRIFLHDGYGDAEKIAKQWVDLAKTDL